MTDRELLELAAKAAEIEVEWREWPVWLTMIVPPIKRPCVWRIATEEETSE